MASILSLLQVAVSLLLLLQSQPTIAPAQQQQIMSVVTQSVQSAQQYVSATAAGQSKIGGSTSGSGTTGGNATGASTAGGGTGTPVSSTKGLGGSGTGSLSGTGSVTISSLSPTTGNVGTQVTITGSGFTTTGNTVHFSSGVVTNLGSSDGKTIVFTVPSSLAPACYYTNPPCMTLLGLTQPGTYPVSVSNANGTSNAMNFTVLSAPGTGY